MKILVACEESQTVMKAFPPCTYLSGAGTSCFSEKRFPIEKIEERKKLREKAAEFFLVFANCKCAKVAIGLKVVKVGRTGKKSEARHFKA